MALIGLLVGDPRQRLAYEEALGARGHTLIASPYLHDPHRILAESPQLLVVDANPTETSDLELVAYLRRSAGRSSLPILLLCGGSEEEYLRAFAAGVSDCLDRRVDLSELLAKIDRFTSAELCFQAELPWVGQVVLGRYRLDAVLGQGAFGSVFSAWDREVEQQVAFKVLLEAEGSEARDRFMREAYTLGSIRSPHVAQIYDFGEEPDFLYIVMELVAGPTLRKRVERDGPCSAEQALALTRGMAEALAVTHEAGFLHRDLKPANFILREGRYERPVLVDFGLAKSSVDTAVTAVDMVMGTPGYMAPELLERDGDERSDLFALGHCAVFAARGEEWLRALRGFELLKATARRPIPVPKFLPQPLRTILLELTAIDAGARPPSARALLAELEALDPGPAEAPRVLAMPSASWLAETEKTPRWVPGAPFAG